MTPETTNESANAIAFEQLAEELAKELDRARSLDYCGFSATPSVDAEGCIVGYDVHIAHCAADSGEFFALCELAPALRALRLRNIREMDCGA